MEIESLKQLVEQNLPEDLESFLEDLILKVIIKALERLYQEGSKWIQEDQHKQERKKSEKSK